MRSALRSAAGGAVMLMALAGGLVSLGSGWIIDGREPPAVQCESGPYPRTGGPFHETTRITGSVTILPLGVDCTYDVDGDEVGPQTVRHPNMPATAGFLGSALTFAAGAALLIVRTGRTEPVSAD